MRLLSLGDRARILGGTYGEIEDIKSDNQYKINGKWYDLNNIKPILPACKYIFHKGEQVVAICLCSIGTIQDRKIDGFKHMYLVKTDTETKWLHEKELIGAEKWFEKI